MQLVPHRGRQRSPRGLDHSTVDASHQESLGCQEGREYQEKCDEDRDTFETEKERLVMRGAWKLQRQKEAAASFSG